MQQFLEFLDSAPTAFHAAEQCRRHLLACGFAELQEAEPWELKPSGRYFTVRGGASVAAWIQPEQEVHRCLLAAAHSDSPALKLKPHAEFEREGFLMLGVEVYGAPLLNSWLNRDLGIAGQIYTRSGDLKLVREESRPVTIPQLAIHLDREVNTEGLKLNKQEHLNAIAGLADGRPFLENLFGKNILAHDLFLYPLERARTLGELVASYRIDNLSSAFACLHALASEEAAPHTLKALMIWDHEEIGSETDRGAASPIALHLLERILGRERLLRLLPVSLTLSCDSAHGVHPNYSDRHEVRHRPRLGAGPVLKWNSQRRYATDAPAAGLLARIAEKEGIPLQQFVVRSDIPCGSTIGPIHAAKTGMPTVDLGLPQLSMHGARELCALQDLDSLTRLIRSAFSS